MLVDFSFSNPSMYFTGILPVYSTYKVAFIGKYSNKLIDNGTEYFPVRLSDSGDYWFKMECINIIDLEDAELDVYYDCILYGYDAQDRETFIQKVLCKVKNEQLISYPDTEYVSDNENNEQFIYYNND